MKCPNCDFIDKDEAFGDPAKCPKCGAIYEKALRIKADKERQALFEKRRLESQPVRQGAPLKSRMSSARASVSDGREKRAAAEAQRKQKRELQMVVVTDIDMPFMSMVSFMIRWVLASIPAAIILMIILTGVPVFFGSLFF